VTAPRVVVPVLAGVGAALSGLLVAAVVTAGSVLFDSGRSPWVSVVAAYLVGTFPGALVAIRAGNRWSSSFTPPIAAGAFSAAALVPFLLVAAAVTLPTAAVVVLVAAVLLVPAVVVGWATGPADGYCVCAN